MNLRTLDILSGVRPFWALTILCALLYLPGNTSLPPIDRDEARFMQSTKQMIEIGDYSRIRFQAEPRDKKPVGAHWLQAAAVNLLSANDLTQPWPYRLASVIGVWLAVMATAWAAMRVASPAVGLAAGAILATSVLAIAEAHLAKADGLLLGVSAVVMTGFLQAYHGRSLSTLTLVVIWAALGAGILIKGPILFGIVVLAVIALGVADKSIVWLARLKPVMGIAFMMVVSAAWPLVAGWDEVLRFAHAALSQDLLPKMIGGVESHGAPPGTHLVAATLTLWPWSWAVPLAAILAWKQRENPIVRFCVAWIVPFWLLLELAPTKLPHYPLPLFPAIALLIALTLSGQRAWAPARIMTVGIAGLALLGTVVTITVVAVGERFPRWSDLNLSQNLAAALKRQSASDRPFILVGYHEPSAVFLLGTQTILTNAENAASLLISNQDAIAAVAQPDLAALESFMAAAGLKISRLEEVSGYNYSRGAPINMVVVRSIPSPGP